MPGAMPADQGPQKADPDEVAPKPDPRYEELQLTDDEVKAFKKQEPRIRSILKAGKFANPAEKALFDKYVSDYFLRAGHGRRTLPASTDIVRNCGLLFGTPRAARSLTTLTP